MIDRRNILNRLRADDPQTLDELWREADETRRRCVGDAVHLRGLVEISNRCVRRCAYCGLRSANKAVRRYCMGDDEVLAAARLGVELGYGTVVLQAGEDPELTGDRVASLVRRIKAETDLAVTLSLGERAEGVLAEWRRAGADRYLLRFETSNRGLYDRIHPPGPGGPFDRVEMLRALRRLGYEVGSGVMVGIPGQTHDDLAGDLELFEELDLDMIGLGPFIPHAGTPLGALMPVGEDPVPNTERMALKMIALTRLARPMANIPATTALATINPVDGRELALRRGANVVMPNLTPPKYRPMYEIYPAKACIAETAQHCSGCIRGRIASIGRTAGDGRGDSPNYRARNERQADAVEVQ